MIGNFFEIMAMNAKMIQFFNYIRCTNQPKGEIIYLSNIIFIISVLFSTILIYCKLKNSNMNQISIVEKYIPTHPHIVRNAASYLLVFFLQWVNINKFIKFLIYKL